MALKSAFICPFCFDEPKISDAEFRCTNRRCVDVPDLELTKYENGDLSNPKPGKTTFKAPSKGFNLPRSAKCPECSGTTYAVVCPSCHNKLPESTLRGEDLIISVVGGRNTGKSHFVGVIINELIERISVGFDGAMEGFDERFAIFCSQYIYSP